MFHTSKMWEDVARHQATCMTMIAVLYHWSHADRESPFPTSCEHLIPTYVSPHCHEQTADSIQHAIIKRQLITENFTRHTNVPPASKLCIDTQILIVIKSNRTNDVSSTNLSIISSGTT